MNTTSPDQSLVLEQQSKFTPGPWSVGYTNPKDYGGGIIHFYSSVHVGTGTTKGNVIATVGMGGPGATTSTEDAVEANARLIAAAPDLLAALYQIAQGGNSVRTGWSAFPAIDRETMCDVARAAIAKATGGA